MSPGGERRDHGTSQADVSCVLSQGKTAKMGGGFGAVRNGADLSSSFWTPEGEEPAPSADAGSSAEYSQSLEQELSRIISAITGEKSPAVLVTLEDSGRSLYAEDGRSTTQQGEASSEERESTHVLFEDSQGNQQPLTITRTQPQVQGVVVVSAFAEDPATREKLVTAVCTALDLSSAKVCVVSGG